MFELLILASRSAVEHPGVYASRMVAAGFLVIGLLKCRSISRRSTTSTMCVGALAMVLGSLFAIMVLGEWVATQPPSGLWFAFVVVAGLVFLGGFVLAIVSLRDYKRHPEYRQGRRQAIGAIAIVVLMTASAIHIITEMRKDPLADGNDSASSLGLEPKPLPEGKVLTYPDSGFRYRMPDGEYTRFKAERRYPNAKLGLVRFDEEMVGLVVNEEPIHAETLVDLEALVKVNQAQLRSRYSDMSTYSNEPHTINGMEGRRFCVDALVAGQRKTFIYWIYASDGRLYQQMVFGLEKDKKFVQREAEKLFRGFELINQ